MQFETPAGRITLVYDPVYSFGSADNTRRYPCEQRLDTEYAPSSIHGVLLDEQPLVVFGGAGGCSVHEYVQR